MKDIGEPVDNRKREPFNYAIIIIIAGYIVSLNPYWWIFGTPLIYLTGVILIWLSKKSKLSKVLFTILPIIFWLPGFWLYVYFGTRHATPETFLIPQNFRGKIVLYYGEPCGQELQKVNGRYIYHIPQNGVMIFKNPLETGIIDQEYFFVNPDGKKISKIDMFIQQDFNEEYTTEKNKHEPSRNKVAVFLGGTGTGSVNMANQHQYNFHEMYVDAWDSLRVYNSKRIDSVALNLLNGCVVKK
jgi:hypothetical protein